MDKQKKLNERHQILLSAGYDWWKTAPNGKTKSEYEAECFYNAGYRKIPENAVVLTQKELIEMQLKYYNGGAEETAEKFAERVKSLFDIEQWYTVADNKKVHKAIDEICKEIRTKEIRKIEVTEENK